MEMVLLLTHSGLTYPEVSLKVCHDSFCQLENSVSLPWVIYYEAFCLHVVSTFSCISVICLKLVLFLILLQFVYLFCNLSQVYPASNTVIHKLYFSMEVCYNIVVFLSPSRQMAEIRLWLLSSTFLSIECSLLYHTLTVYGASY
jgi:hypothetical protein